MYSGSDASSHCTRLGGQSLRTFARNVGSSPYCCIANAVAAAPAATTAETPVAVLNIGDHVAGSAAAAGSDAAAAERRRRPRVAR